MSDIHVTGQINEMKQQPVVFPDLRLRSGLNILLYLLQLSEFCCSTLPGTASLWAINTTFVKSLQTINTFTTYSTAAFPLVYCTDFRNVDYTYLADINLCLMSNEHSSNSLVQTYFIANQ